MGLMDNKKGVVFGVANHYSYAWFISKALAANGATCAFAHFPGEKMERRVKSALDEMELDNPWMAPCDASKDEDLDELFAKLKNDFGSIDFIVHSIAFADAEYLKADMFHKTTRKAWTSALDISAYTLIAMAQRGMAIMPDGGALISMSYYGGEKVIPRYNIMGIAKAALEHTTRYLAAELGGRKIRVNCISGGPIKTAASKVVGVDDIIGMMETKAPLRRNISGEDVADTAVFLLSDMSRGITGEVIYVDAGYNIIGV